jgi:hypothetical protein
MKQLISILVLVSFTTSCIQQNTNKSFIVESISNDNLPAPLCIYQIQSYQIIEFDIIDTIGKFNIGDTLTLEKIKK